MDQLCKCWLYLLCVQSLQCLHVLPSADRSSRSAPHRSRGRSCATALTGSVLAGRGEDHAIGKQRRPDKSAAMRVQLGPCKGLQSDEGCALNNVRSPDRPLDVHMNHLMCTQDRGPLCAVQHDPQHDCCLCCATKRGRLAGCMLLPTCLGRTDSCAMTTGTASTAYWRSTTRALHV